MNHSKEPWSIYDKDDNLVDAEGVHFLACGGISNIRGEFRRTEPLRDDLRRIVACVNLLAGIPDHVLEAVASGDLGPLEDTLETIYSEKLLEAIVGLRE